MVGIFVANTDHEWFDFLAAQPGLREANFWRPSPQALQAIGAGELFVFRLKSPRDRIGGFGVLSTSTVLPLQMAWEAFGTANGVPTYDALRNLIRRYRAPEVVGPSTNIGCNALVDTVFLPPELWFEVPEGWSRNIVWGKRFSTDNEQGRRLWDRLHDAAQASLVGTLGGFSEPRYGEPTLIAPRLGQGAFRLAVTEAYGRQCALTTGKVLPALDAAHIVPYGEGGTHAKSNGILLRKDIHSVFDAGYATIDTDYRFVVSDKVREVFNNGEEYRRLHGVKMRLPAALADRPDRALLTWHNYNRYLG
ncbi:MAG: HNH endonuclease [Bauldia sp.]